MITSERITKTFVRILLAIAGLIPCSVGARDFCVRDYGAQGDGQTKDTRALQQAIDACGAANGGRVVLADGTFLTGALQLRSGVDLYIDRTARLLASPDLGDFPDWPNPRHVDTAKLPRGRNACIIFADEADRIAITGDGVIDCNGMTHVKVKDDPNWTGWGYVRKHPLIESLPRAVFLAGCRDVRLENVTMTNQPAGWSYWIHDCDRVQIRGLKILADVHYPNNDGIHLNCSRDVTVSDCLIETGDDALVIRANSRSLRENKPMERVMVENCVLRSWSAGIRFGWANDGVMRNCTFSNLVIHDTTVGIAFMLVAPHGLDYGCEATLIEGMNFSNIRMDGIYAHPILATIAASTNSLVQAVRDIRFANVHARGLQYPHFCGRPDVPLRDFTFDHCSFVKVPDAALPGSSRRHGAAAWDRHPVELLEHVTGFLFDGRPFGAFAPLDPTHSEATSDKHAPKSFEKKFLDDEIRRTKPDYVVYRPHAAAGFDDHGNEHFHVFRVRGVLCSLWTMSDYEATFSQRPVFATSRDDGKTWTNPKCILKDPIDPKTGRNMGSWAAAAVSKSGRIYVFYVKHLGDGTDHETGRMYVLASDDIGETWLDEAPFEMPYDPRYDIESPAKPVSLFPWQNALRLTDGTVLMGLSHNWKNPKMNPDPKHRWPEHPSGCEIMRLDNLDDDPPPAKLKASFFARCERSLNAPLRTDPTRRTGEEPSLVELPDGRVMCMFRTAEGHVWYSISADRGETWRPTEMLRYQDDGEGMKHPLSPCPCFRIGEDRYVIFIHDNDGFFGKDKPQITGNWRNPLYMVEGKFRPDAHQPIWFERPRELMNNGDVAIARRDLAIYGDLTLESDGPVLWYPDRKFFLLGRKLASLLNKCF